MSFGQSSKKPAPQDSNLFSNLFFNIKQPEKSFLLMKTLYMNSKKPSNCLIQAVMAPLMPEN